MSASRDTFEFLGRTRSVRRFSAAPVAPQLVEAALRAGQRAPSASNHQAYSVIDIDDPALRQRIAGAMVTQPFVPTAPVWLMVCVDWSRQDELARSLGVRTKLNRAARRFVGIVDASIFAHHVGLALMAQGLGVCLVASPWTALARVADELGLPRRAAMPLHLIVAGHLAEEPPARPRYPLELVLSRNRYRAPDREAIARYLDEGDRLLRNQGYFDGPAAEVASWHELYRLRYGAVARKRTWTPLRRDLAQFL